MTNPWTAHLVPLLGFALFVTGLALAWQSPACADGSRALPPEAYAVCESKAAGDGCMVNLQSWDIAGRCAVDQDNGRLFCRPPGRPPPPPDDCDVCDLLPAESW